MPKAGALVNENTESINQLVLYNLAISIAAPVTQVAFGWRQSSGSLLPNAKCTCFFDIVRRE